MPTLAAQTRLHDRLRSETRAEVFFDPGRRGLYATDASLYQIDPIGVVVPRTVDDVIQAVRIAAEEGVPVLPRGAATSLSGQTIGPALVLDVSKYLNRVGVVDRDRMTVRAAAGLDDRTYRRARQRRCDGPWRPALAVNASSPAACDQLWAAGTRG